MPRLSQHANPVKIKYSLLIFIVFFASITLYTETGNSSPAKNTAQKDVLYQVLAKKEIRIGVSELAPWVMHDRNGKLIGFEIDIARQLAKDMGVKAVFRQYEWNRMIPALLKGEIDIIASGLSITPQRSLKVNFSAPYSSSGYSLVSNLSLTKDFTSIHDLDKDNIYITAVKGTVSAELAGKIFPHAKLDLKNTEKEASAAVLEGTVHAFVASSPVPEFLTTKHPDKCDLPLSKPLLKTNEGFAVNKGNQEMLNYLNDWIVAHKADEWIHSTYKYWFKSLRWQRKLKPE